MGLTGEYILKASCDCCSRAEFFHANSYRRAVEMARIAQWSISKSPLTQQSLVRCPEHNTRANMIRAK